MRFSVDTGGTFTDLVVEDDDGRFRLYKSPTTPDDPVEGIFNVLGDASASFGLNLPEFLARGEMFVHATTRAINALLTETTARTALLTTQGHRDILLLREGGKERFNLHAQYPSPYVPRSLTFEIPERIGSRGEIVVPLDEQAVCAVVHELAAREVEAVAVCFLWSIVNSAHELRVGELLDELLPNVPYTLSHQLNPSLREYRRASSTAIDASLKPVMTGYLHKLSQHLRAAGFGGRLLMVTSSGGVLDGAIVAETPIHTINSGPSMAPVAARHFARLDVGSDTVVVTDAGGTSYDVSLVRCGRIPWTRETWIGSRYTGHMTGFPSVDVKSIGAGGGSIAWVDGGGLLHVGPQSAGSLPGPVCYGRGGTRPTVTDAALVLGYIDPRYFLGGTMHLDVDAATEALDRFVGHPLGLPSYEAGAAVIQLVTEHMVRAIDEITLSQGVDPRGAVVVGGGGAAGLNAVAIARRLGCTRLIIPEAGATLSAAGALMSDLSADFRTTFSTSTRGFDSGGVNAVLEDLQTRCQEFIAQSGVTSQESSIELFVECHYPREVWDLEVPLRIHHFCSPQQVEQLRQDFHAVHHEILGVSDPGSAVEFVSWRARARCALASGEGRGEVARTVALPDTSRPIYFSGIGLVGTKVRHLEAMLPGEQLHGPAIIESAVTTVVVDHGAVVERGDRGSLLITPTNSQRSRPHPRDRALV